jgi:hypothetical protein
MPVPNESIPDKGYKLYCHDSRKDICPYYVKHKEENYCTYPINKKKK